MTEQFASLEAAKLLTQLGYDGEYSHAYNNEEELISELSAEEIDAGMYFPAPLWQDALEWIGSVHGLFIGEIVSADIFPDAYFCKVVNRSNNVVMGVSARGPILFSVIEVVTMSMLRQAISISKMKEVLGNKVFPNGFQSWKETYFEVVSHIVEANNKGDNVVTDIAASQGTTGLYDLAEDTTDLFEEAYSGSTWDEKDYFEEVENFCNKQFKRDEDEKSIL